MKTKRRPDERRFALEMFEPLWPTPNAARPSYLGTRGHELVQGARAARRRARKGSTWGCLVLMFFQGQIVGVYFNGERVDGYRRRKRVEGYRYAYGRQPI